MVKILPLAALIVASSTLLATATTINDHIFLKDNT